MGDKTQSFYAQERALATRSGLHRSSGMVGMVEDKLHDLQRLQERNKQLEHENAELLRENRRIHGMLDLYQAELARVADIVGVRIVEFANIEEHQP